MIRMYAKKPLAPPYSHKGIVKYQKNFSVDFLDVKISRISFFCQIQNFCQIQKWERAIQRRKYTAVCGSCIAYRTKLYAVATNKLFGLEQLRITRPICCTATHTAVLYAWDYSKPLPKKIYRVLREGAHLPPTEVRVGSEADDIWSNSAPHYST